MLAKVNTISNIGLDCRPVVVEADMSNGLPGFIVVGMANKAVDEAKERVRSAIKNSNLNLPPRKITLNLAPADLPKGCLLPRRQLQLKGMGFRPLLEDPRQGRIFIALA